MHITDASSLDRRQFVRAVAACGLAAPTMRARGEAAVEGRVPTGTDHPRRAEACIFIWLAGGVAANDTWAPKPFTPFRRGMPAHELLSTCGSIETAARGVWIAEGLEAVASVLDRGCILRAVAPGGAARGTTSDDADELAAVGANPPTHADAQRRLLSFERDLVRRLGVTTPTLDRPAAADFASSMVEARRDIERGARFVRVTFPYEPFAGFDTHDHGARRMVALKRQIDRPIAELVRGLERSALLERTLVVVASEFGRTAGPARGASRRVAATNDIALEDESDYGFHGHFAERLSIACFGGGARRGVAIEDTVSIDDVGAMLV